MNSVRLKLLAVAPMLIMLATSALLYPSLPEQLPSISSDPDDTQSKLLIAVLLPGIYVMTLSIVFLMVNNSPKKFSMPNSRSAVGSLIFASGILFCFCHYASLNHQGEFDFFVNYFTWGMAVFLIIAGNVMGKTERNFVFGIYLPWTLASEENWRASHRVAGRLWVAIGILLCVVNIWINHLGLVIAATTLPLLVMTIYSYRYYAINEKPKENEDE